MNIGSGWKKEKNGKKYLSCVIQSPFVPEGEIRFAIFPVDEKKSENSPDYNIAWNKRKNENQSNDYQSPPSSSPVSDEDIPF